MPGYYSPEIMVEVSAAYLIKRQLQGRPTTLRQLGKRAGLGSSRVLDALESVGLRYVLVPYQDIGGRNKIGVGNTEVLVQYLPEAFSKRILVDPNEVEESYSRIVGDRPKPIKQYTEAVAKGQTVSESIDPYAPYRISLDQYEVLRDSLITYEELVQVGRENGFSVAAIRRATGGDRMRHPLPSFWWRPYVVGKKRYYLKDVLDHLAESDNTYVSRGKLRKRRLERTGDPTLTKFIMFDRRKKAVVAVEKKAEKQRFDLEKDASRKRAKKKKA